MWITQFKWYLSAAGLDHKNQDSAAAMNIAAACLKGSAAQWFARITSAGQTPLNFEDFCEKLKAQFGVIDEKRRARDKMMTLRHSTSVEDYIHKF